MSANTTIEWATKSWNPVRGCSRVSPGCDQCYAMKFAHRFSGAGKPYEGLTTVRKGKVDWSGVARFIPSELDAPLRWRKPQRIFVNSMSDLFHSGLTGDAIGAVFGVMAAATNHQFLVLTKRPERALDFFQKLGFTGRERERCAELALGFLPTSAIGERPASVLRKITAIKNAGSPLIDGALRPWPLPNVWLGVSCENQETADERIPLLLKCPATVRWISAEPLLGPLDLTRIPIGNERELNALTGERQATTRHLAVRYGGRGESRLQWVIVGGESGPGARPLDIAWVRSLVAQCRAVSVPVFFKQGGSSQRCAHDSKGGHFECFPKDLRVREFPNARS